MIYRAAAALFALSVVVLAGFLFRPATPHADERTSRNGALLPEVELTESVPAPIVKEMRGDGRPVALIDTPDPVPAPIPQEVLEMDAAVPLPSLFKDKSLIERRRFEVRPKHSSNSR